MLIKGLAENNLDLEFITMNLEEKRIPAELEKVKVTTLLPGAISRLLKRVIEKFKKKGSQQAVFEEKDSYLFALYSFLFLHGNLLPLLRFCLKTFAAIKKALQSEKKPVLITSVPPASLHLVGAAAKFIFKNKIIWIADYQDPVSYSPFLKSTGLFIYTMTDKLSFVSCDLVTVPFENLKGYLLEVKKKLSVDKKTRFYVLPKGIERKDSAFSTDAKSLRIFYGGSIYASQLRGLIALFDAVKSQDGFSFVYAGPSHEIVESLAKKAGIREFRIYKLLPHHEFERVAAESDILLVLATFIENAVFYGGKLYELLGYNKPVLFIGPESMEVKEIALNAGGVFMAKDDASEIAQILRRLKQILRKQKNFRNEKFLIDFSPYAVAKRFLEDLNITEF